MATSEADIAAQLIERLLTDPAFRARFRRNPAEACRDAGLDELAQEMSLGAGKAMMTLDVRESKSSLAGVMMAAAMEGVGVYEFAQHVAPALDDITDQIGDVLSRVSLPAIGAPGGLGGASGASAGGVPDLAVAAPADAAADGGGGAGAAAAAPPPAPAATPEEAAAAGGEKEEELSPEQAAAAKIAADAEAPTAQEQADAAAAEIAAAEEPELPDGEMPDAPASDLPGEEGGFQAESLDAEAPEAQAAAPAAEPASAEVGGEGFLAPADAPAEAPEAEAKSAEAAPVQEAAPTAPPAEEQAAPSRPPNPAEYGQDGTGGPITPETQALLDNPNITFDEVGQADLEAGKIDPRVVSALTKLSEDHKITVTCMCSDHSKFTAGGSISNHAHGRGVDIGTIDGEIVRPGSAAARELASELSQLDEDIRPNEIGSPFPIAGPGYFTDGAHQDHIHFGFKEAITPDWKPPADVAAPGGPAVAGAAAVGAPGAVVIGEPVAATDSGSFMAVTPEVAAKAAAAGVSAEEAASGMTSATDSGAFMAVAAQPAAAPVAAAVDTPAGGGAMDEKLAGVAANAETGYPGDNASKEQIAAWMATEAEKRGLPPELPIMASMVESNMQNLNYGDASSVGYFQMLTTLWNTGEYEGYPEKPELQLKWFLDTAERVMDQRVSRGLPIDDPSQFGVWIADTERPAAEYRGRYQLKLAEAQDLLAKSKDAAPVAPEAPAAGGAVMPVPQVSGVPGAPVGPAGALAPDPAALAAGAPSAGGGSPLGSAALEIAKGKLGIQEINHANTSPDIDQFLASAGVAPGNPWCASFVTWSLEKAGHKMDGSGWAAVQTWVRAAEAGNNNLQIVSAEDARPGDIVAYDWGGQDDFGADGHIGFLASDVDANGQFKTVEGNESDAVSNVDRHMGGGTNVKFIRIAGEGTAPAGAPPAGGAPVASAAAVAPGAAVPDAGPASDSGSFMAVTAEDAAEASAAGVSAEDAAAGKLEASDSGSFMAVTPDQAAAAPAAAVPAEAAAADAALSGLGGAGAYPGDDAPKEQIALWMAQKAEAAGLPPELPVMAGLVESNMTNLNYGDASSVGYFQMLTTIWDKGEYAGYLEDPEKQIQWFIDTASPLKERFGGLPPTAENLGTWVADTERPAAQYRGRYALRLEEARELIEKGRAAAGDAPVAPAASAAAAVGQPSGVPGAADEIQGRAGVSAEAEQAGPSRPPDPEEYGQDGTGGPMTPEIKALLDNPNITFDEVGEADLEAGKIDPRVVATLTKLGQDHEITVTCMCSDHSKFTAGGSISNHAHGRGVDIGTIDGEIVRPGSAAARELASELSQLDEDIRPNEIGSPFAIAGPGYFTDAAHQDHIHFGFKEAITPDWKPPADVAGGGAVAAAVTAGAPVVSGVPGAPVDPGAPVARVAVVGAVPGAPAGPLAVPSGLPSTAAPDAGSGPVSPEVGPDSAAAKADVAEADKPKPDEPKPAGPKGDSASFMAVTPEMAEAARAADVSAEDFVAGLTGSDSGAFLAVEPGGERSADIADAASAEAAAPGSVLASAGEAIDLSSVSEEYPGDNATKAEIAAWMGKLAEDRGLPAQLPVMAGLVESGLRNLNYGDADSLGFFQMREGIWDRGDYAGFAEEPGLQVQWFLDQAEAAKAQRISLGLGVDDTQQFGDWVADVERPAEQYRGRYQLRLAEATNLLRLGSQDAPSAPEFPAA